MIQYENIKTEIDLLRHGADKANNEENEFPKRYFIKSINTLRFNVENKRSGCLFVTSNFPSRHSLLLSDIPGVDRVVIAKVK